MTNKKKQVNGPVYGLTYTEPSKSIRYDEPFLTLHQRSYFVMTRNINRAEKDVLDFFLAVMGYHNWVHIQRKRIAALTGHSVSTVSRSITILRREGLIRKYRNDVYMVSPEIAWKGTVADYKDDSPKTKETHDRMDIYDHGKFINTMWFERVPEKFPNDPLHRISNPEG